MDLDGDIPDPPDLTNRGVPADVDPADGFDSLSDLRREELEEVLRDGAWAEAFEAWAEFTDLTAREYRTVRDLGLFEQLDVYWDPASERLRFEVPDLPEELSAEDDLGGRAASELTDLGHVVVETIEDGYVEWGEGEPLEDSWSGETFGDES